MRASPATTPPSPPPTQTSSASAAGADGGAAASGAGDGRLVYFFGDGAAEGTKDMRAVLGSKGANLAEMTNLGVPVPPGFTIACSACMDYLASGGISPSLRQEVSEHLSRLEQTTGKRLGDPSNPLLVSVRSGAAVSMPGMMERSEERRVGKSVDV